MTGCIDLTWPLAIALILTGVTAGVCILAILIGGRGPWERERDSDQRDTETGSPPNIGGNPWN